MKLPSLIIVAGLCGAFSPVKASGPRVFSESEEVLAVLVKEKAETTANHLYVSAIKKSGDHSFAWVYWKEKRQLILWEPFDPQKTKLAWSRRILDLDKDVVSNNEELKGSTYLVDKAWVGRTIEDCMKNGRAYIIQK